LSVAGAYIGKTGRDYIGWTDVGGQYRADTRTLADGRSVPVFVLVNSPAARRFLVTNPAGYSLKYNGLVLAAEKRVSNRWQALGSYTFSRATGLQATSGTTAGGGQFSTIALNSNIFGRDPNDLTNARGLLPNDRPHMFRVMGTLEMPRTGLTIATNFQYYTGKPWAATTQVTLPQGSQRIQLEPRGTRRLSPQSLLDLRVSRTLITSPRTSCSRHPPTDAPPARLGASQCVLPALHNQGAGRESRRADWSAPLSSPQPSGCR